MQHGKTFAVGGSWDLAKVESVHEVKTSAINRFEGNQRERYLQLTDNGEKLHLHFTRYTYDQAGGKMVLNDRYVAREMIFRTLGLASTVFVGAVWARSLNEFEALITKTDRTVGWAAKIAHQREMNSLQQLDVDTYAREI